VRLDHLLSREPWSHAGETHSQVDPLLIEKRKLESKNEFVADRFEM
jgi:hypothetical protein